MSQKILGRYDCMTLWLEKGGGKSTFCIIFFFRSHPHWSLWLINECQSLRTALAANAARQLAQQISWAFVRSPTEDSDENGRRVKILDWTWLNDVFKSNRFQMDHPETTCDESCYSRHFDEFSIHFNLETSTSSQTWTCHSWPWWGRCSRCSCSTVGWGAPCLNGFKQESWRPVCHLSVHVSFLMNICF